jgi:hypothetical protein
MSRGFLTVLLLVPIALVSIAFARRLERERRLLAKLRRGEAFDASRAMPMENLTADERDTAADLELAGVLRERGGAHYIDAQNLQTFRRKRVRFAFSGALAALGVAILVALAILGR